MGCCARCQACGAHLSSPCLSLPLPPLLLACLLFHQRPHVNVFEAERVGDEGGGRRFAGAWEKGGRAMRCRAAGRATSAAAVSLSLSLPPPPSASTMAHLASPSPVCWAGRGRPAPAARARRRTQRATSSFVFVFCSVTDAGACQAPASLVWGQRGGGRSGGRTGEGKRTPKRKNAARCDRRRSFFVRVGSIGPPIAT